MWILNSLPIQINQHETRTVICWWVCVGIYFRCDRILWHGNGMEQVSYTRGESRFSDHRPVCAIFLSGVELPSKEKGGRKPFYSAGERIQVHDCIPQRHSFYEL